LSPRVALALAAFAAAALPAPASSARVERVERHLLSARAIEGCAGLPYPRRERQIDSAGDVAVDAAARFWEIDRPAAYVSGRSVRRYRVGEGALEIEAELDPALDRETVRIRVAEPIAPEYFATYLPEVSLPCERVTHYSVAPRSAGEADLDALARFDAALLEATERLYDADFAGAEARLREAMALRPNDPTPYWMMARLRYLSLEGRAPALSRAERIAGYEDAERWADGAVSRAPTRAEGFLWQAIARGRIATSRGSLDLAMRGWLGGRGPAWLEATMRKAVSLPEDFRFFGFSTRGDALHTLAQFYRLAPSGWYMSLVGASGNLDRAIELSREAVALQPVRIEYRKELAVELLCRGSAPDRREAEAEIRALLAIPAITAIDRIDHAHAQALLAEPRESACGYSRDAFGGSAA
jgi:hypothetical protein